METTCPICFEDLEGKVKASPNTCDHVFCLSCLEKWAKLGSFCPVDRKRFKKIVNLESENLIQVKPRKRKRTKTVYDFSSKCEVCSKDNHSVLLLCDSCDLSFHLFCLTPPLETVPAGLWFCPTCISVEAKIKQKSGITKEVEADFGNVNLQLEEREGHSNVKTILSTGRRQNFVEESFNGGKEPNSENFKNVGSINAEQCANSVETCFNAISEFQDLNVESKCCSYEGKKITKTYDKRKVKHRKISKIRPLDEMYKVWNVKPENTIIHDLNTLKEVSLLDDCLSQAVAYGEMKIDIEEEDADNVCKTGVDSDLKEIYKNKNLYSKRKYVHNKDWELSFNSRFRKNVHEINSNKESSQHLSMTIISQDNSHNSYFGNVNLQLEEREGHSKVKTILSTGRRQNFVEESFNGGKEPNSENFKNVGSIKAEQCANSVETCLNAISEFQDQNVESKCCSYEGKKITKTYDRRKVKQRKISKIRPLDEMYKVWNGKPENTNIIDLNTSKEVSILDDCLSQAVAYGEMKIDIEEEDADNVCKTEVDSDLKEIYKNKNLYSKRKYVHNKDWELSFNSRFRKKVHEINSNKESSQHLSMTIISKDNSHNSDFGNVNLQLEEREGHSKVKTILSTGRRQNFVEESFNGGKEPNSENFKNVGSINADQCANSVETCFNAISDFQELIVESKCCSYEGKKITKTYDKRKVKHREISKIHSPDQMYKVWNVKPENTSILDLNTSKEVSILDDCLSQAVAYGEMKIDVKEEDADYECETEIVSDVKNSDKEICKNKKLYSKKKYVHNKDRELSFNSRFRKKVHEITSPNKESSQHHSMTIISQDNSHNSSTNSDSFLKQRIPENSMPGVCLFPYFY